MALLVPQREAASVYVRSLQNLNGQTVDMEAKTSNRVHQIPDDLPDDGRIKSNIENIKKRRSSIRRSTNCGGGFHSTLRVACSVLSSAPPEEKKKRITELCFNHALQSLKQSAGDEEYDAIYDFEEQMRKKLPGILERVIVNGNDTVEKQESQIKRSTNRIMEEKDQWQVEFQKRRQGYLDTVTKYKEAKQGKFVVGKGQKTKLKPKDAKFLSELPNFKELNSRLPIYENTLFVGLVQMEVLSEKVKRELSSEKKLDVVHDKLTTDAFDWKSLL